MRNCSLCFVWNKGLDGSRCVFIEKIEVNCKVRRYWETEQIFEQPSEAVLKKNARESVQKQKKKGTQYDPVIITGRTIAKSWWGKAWCDNLEKYADFSSRRIMDDEENAQSLFGVL